MVLAPTASHLGSHHQREPGPHLKQGLSVDSRYETGQAVGMLGQAPLQLSAGICDRRIYAKLFGAGCATGGRLQGKDLRFAGAVRGGFNPSLRRSVHDTIKHLEIARCPFVNLPVAAPARLGMGITREKMSGCIWLKPTTVAEIEFAEWTPDERQYKTTGHKLGPS